MLKKYRMEKTRYTQQDMAELLKISLSNYARIERNNNCPVILAKSISHLFGDSIENIFYK